MKYLKVFTDFAEDMELLGDAEIGRLFKAMLLYAETGTEQNLQGNERFLWGTAKKNIDNQRKSYDAKSENMAKARKKIIVNKQNLLINNEQIIDEDKDKDKEKKKKPIRDKSLIGGVGDVFKSFAGDNKELLEALAAFEEMRNRIRKPMTDRSRELLLKELRKSPEQDWIPMLEKSVLKCYQSVYPLDEKRSGKGNTAQMLDDSYQMMADWAKERSNV